MQLLVVILNRVDVLPKIISAFFSQKIGGTTVLDCKGALKMLGEQGIEPPPMFGSLRHLMSGHHDEGKLLLSVLPDEKVALAKQTINELVGGIEHADTGIMFTISLSSVEGLAK